MSERDQERDQKYRRVRTDFDELKTEDKVVFLFEAAVTTVARGIDQCGRAISEELSRAFSKRAEPKPNHGAESRGDSEPAGDGETDSPVEGRARPEGAEGARGSSEGSGGSGTEGDDDKREQ